MRLLAAGDPMQLSPTLSSFAEENIAEEGLAKTLFVRLTSIGFQPIMLKTQYRVTFYTRMQFFLRLTSTKLNSVTLN